MVMFIVSADNTGRCLSIKEAALLSGITEKVIRHELAGRVVRPSYTRAGRPRFSARAVLYFNLISELPVDLKTRDRRDLYDLIAAHKDRRGSWKWKAHRLVLAGGVSVELPTEELVRRVVTRVKIFLRGRRRVVSRPEILGGEPVFEGTRISVRHVGMRVKKGEPVANLQEDFPALTKDDLEFARMYVDLGRPPGRPRKLRFICGEG